MATIIHRGSHQWQARVRRKGYPPVMKTFETKAEAKRWARLVESEMDHGAFVSRVEVAARALAIRNEAVGVAKLSEKLDLDDRQGSGESLQPIEKFGGEGGIRTPGPFPVNGFQDPSASDSGSDA